MSGMSVAGIGALGFTPYVPPSVGASAVTSVGTSAGTSVDAVGSTEQAAGTSFADVLAGGIDRLEGMHDTADRLAVQAATGDLASLHEYTIAATEASVATQLTVAVRNKALEAFSEIMRMPI